MRLVFVVVLLISKMGIPDVIDFFKQVVDAMTGNAYFTAQAFIDKLAEVVTNIENLELARADKNEGKEKTAKVKALYVVLKNSMTDLAGLVQTLANKDLETAETVIYSTKMHIRGKGGRAAFSFKLSPTGNPGELLIEMDKVKRGVNELYATTTPNDDASWVRIYAANRASFTATGLTSGEEYSFKYQQITDSIKPFSSVKTMVIL